MNNGDCATCHWYVNHICNCPYDNCYNKEELDQLKCNIYNQAINDFVDAFGEFVAYRYLPLRYIERIAEQMKGE